MYKERGAAMQNPFTTTFSKIPDNTYIPTEQVSEILENFSYDKPSESLYKITGVRGSGKTVLLAKIEEEMSSSDNQRNGWLVYRLTPNRDMLKQLLAALYKESFIKDKFSAKSYNVSASVLGTGGGIGVSKTMSDNYTDPGIELDEMLRQAGDLGRKILIGIDEVSKTKEMIVFASEFGKWMRAGYPVYMVCTGLYENIEQLYNVQNLTFFRRATTVKTEPLNTVRMSEMYKRTLNVDTAEAKELAHITKGYPYAFQELGVLCFKRKKTDDFAGLVEQLKSELFSYSYEKIWEEMSEQDRSLVRLMISKDEYKRDEILPHMEKPGNYSAYRDRLLKRGIITARRSYISLALPYFGDYVREYCG